MPGDHLSRRFHFSFSGIKTAVLRYAQTHELFTSIETRRQGSNQVSHARPSDALSLCDQETLNLIASFQRAVVDDLRRKTFQAAEAFGAATCLLFPEELPRIESFACVLLLKPPSAICPLPSRH